MTRFLTDRTALLQKRRRALPHPALFLHEAAADEVHFRLSVVNRSFNNPAIVTGWPEFWQKQLPEALCVADEDTLALKPETHDFLIHAMSLHWANDPVGQLIQAKRALRPDGLMIAICLGGSTLTELRTVLAEAEVTETGGLSPRVAPMAEIRDLGALMQRSGLALPVVDAIPIKASYRSLHHLARDLRAMGETNSMVTRLRCPTRRAIFDRAQALYTAHYPDQGDRICATFELMVMTGWAPSPDQPQPLRPGSAVARLADALKTSETRLKD